MSITREQRDRLMRLHDTTYLNVPGTAKHADAERDFIAALDSLVAEPAEQPMDDELDAFWCHVAEADFEKNTVTVEMCGNDWFVSAGNWRLIPPADAMAAELKRRQG